VEARRTTDVGEALVRQLVAVLAVGSELLPPDAEAVDDARPLALADDRLADDAAAVVEDADASSVGDPAGRGVDRRDLEHRLALDRAQAGDVDEARVEEVARRRRDHREREAARELRGARRRFVVGDVIRNAEAGDVDTD